MPRKRGCQGAASGSPGADLRAHQASSVQSSPAASGQCSSAGGFSDDDNALISPAQTATESVHLGDRYTGRSRQTGSSGKGATGRAVSAVVGRLARERSRTEQPSPSSGDDFMAVSRGRAKKTAQRALLSSIVETDAEGTAKKPLRTEPSVATAQTRKRAASSSLDTQTSTSQVSTMTDVHTQDVRGQEEAPDMEFQVGVCTRVRVRVAMCMLVCSVAVRGGCCVGSLSQTDALCGCAAPRALRRGHTGVHERSRRFVDARRV